MEDVEDVEEEETGEDANSKGNGKWATAEHIKLLWVHARNPFFWNLLV